MFQKEDAFVDALDFDTIKQKYDSKVKREINSEKERKEGEKKRYRKKENEILSNIPTKQIRMRQIMRK